MSVLETVLIYVAIPLVAYLLITVMARGRRPGGARYRPGSEWTYPPVWWTAHPAALSDSHGDDAPAAENPAGSTAKGGARGRW